MLSLRKPLPSGLDKNGWRRQYAMHECSYCGNQVKRVVIRRKVDSCGCNRKNLRILRATKHNESHESNKTRLYGIWLNMRSRCSNPTLPQYKYYGGKGIKVCGEWESYIVFKEWALSNGYSNHLTIDRKDSGKNYCPENCQWLTKRENSIKSGLVTALKKRKLSLNEADEIRYLYKSGMFSQLRIAKLYKVSQETIWRITSNLSYKLPVVVDLEPNEAFD